MDAQAMLRDAEIGTDDQQASFAEQEALRRCRAHVRALVAENERLRTALNEIEFCEQRWNETEGAYAMRLKEKAGTALKGDAP